MAISKDIFKQLQKEQRNQRILEMGRVEIKPKEYYIKKYEFSQVEEDLRSELEELKSELSNLKKQKTTITLPGNIVQRSVGIPVPIDQGGTGAVTAEQARTNLGVGGTTLNLGDSSTDGSWRIMVSGNNLVIERRESGSWVEKGQFQP